MLKSQLINVVIASAAEPSGNAVVSVRTIVFATRTGRHIVYNDVNESGSKVVPPPLEHRWARSARLALAPLLFVTIVTGCDSTPGKGTLTGRVVLGPGGTSGIEPTSPGSPLPGYAVVVRAASGTTYEVTSASDGTFVFHLRPGSYTLAACNRITVSVHVTTGATTRQDLSCLPN